jgi:predicted SAM-dependent methyltransferase
MMRLRTRIAYQILPPELWSDIKNELALKRSVLSSRQRCRQRLKELEMAVPNGLRLHLGCGRRTIGGWVNVDAAAGQGVDVVWDVRERLPFGSGGTQLIYTEHLLEHLVKADADKLLTECYRVLMPGGRVRIGVPDAEAYLRAYVEGNLAFFQAAERLGGATRPLRTPMEVINQMFRMGGAHKYAWDLKTLAQSLSESGFTHIAKYQPGQASTPLLCLDDPEHAFETLYVEARKGEGHA